MISTYVWDVQSGVEEWLFKFIVLNTDKSISVLLSVYPNNCKVSGYFANSTYPNYARVPLEHRVIVR